MAGLGVGVIHNTINSRFGPKPLIRAEFHDDGLRHVVGNAGAIQPSLLKSAAATAPHVKVVRGLRKL